MALLDDGSLQYLCLKSLAQDFDQFCKNFSSPTCSVPTRFYEFIQEHYSQDLMRILLDLDLMKDEHLVFIINKHMKEINLYHFPDICDLDVVKERLLVVGHTLTKLSMFGETTFSALKPMLWTLSSIKVLKLEYTTCADDSLMIIAKNCPLIKTLNVYACSEVTDDGMKIICSHEYNKLAIEDLDVDRTSVTDSGILYVLENMPSLRIFTCKNLPKAIRTAANRNVQGNDLIIDRVYNLESITITSPRSTLKLCSLLCPFVTELTINKIDVEDQIQTCKVFKKLECLTMDCRDTAPDVCIDSLLVACGFNIKYLQLRNFTISAEILALNCPKLRYLRLDSPTFHSTCTTKVAHVKFLKLRSFHLQDCSLEFMTPAKSTAFIINSSPNLEILSIKYSVMSPYIEKVLLTCTSKLRNINLSSTKVELGLLLEILRQHMSLEKLVIENCGVRGQWGIYGSAYDRIMKRAENIGSGVDIIWEEYMQDIRALRDVELEAGDQLKLSHLMDRERNGLYP